MILGVLEEVVSVALSTNVKPRLLFSVLICTGCIQNDISPEFNFDTFHLFIIVPLCVMKIELSSRRAIRRIGMSRGTPK